MGDEFEELAKKYGVFDDDVKPQGDPLRTLTDFAKGERFTITSTNKGKHNPGSAHLKNRAIDVRTRDKTNAQIDAFISRAKRRGIRVLDERRRPVGQKVWSGPHLHLEDSEQKRKPKQSIDLDAEFDRLADKYGVFGDAKPTPTVPRPVAPINFDTVRDSDSVQTLGGTETVPDGQPASVPSVVPETITTLEQQMLSARNANSPKAATLFTDPKQVGLLSPELFQGFERVEVSNGVLFVNPVKARAMGVSDYAGGLAKLIGKVEDVGNNTGTGIALKTVDASGGELSSSIVSPESIALQAAVDRAAYPQAASQQVRSAQDIVNERKLEAARRAAIRIGQGYANIDLQPQPALPSQILLPNDEPGKAAVEQQYHQFLKETGLQDSPESIKEFNTVQAAIGQQRKEAGDIYNKQIQAYNANLPKGTQRQTVQARPQERPSQLGSTRPIADAEPKEFTATFASTGDILKDKAEFASRIASALKVDYDTARDFIDRGLESEQGIKYSQELAGRAGGQERTFALDANAVEQLRETDRAYKEQLAKYERLAAEHEQQGLIPSVAQLRALKDIGVKETGGKPIDDAIAEEQAAFERSEAALGDDVTVSGGGSAIEPFYNAERTETTTKRRYTPEQIREILARDGSFIGKESREKRITETYGDPIFGSNTRPMARPSEFALTLGREFLKLPGQAANLLGMATDAMSPAGIDPKVNPIVQFGEAWKKRVDAAKNQDLKDELIVGQVAPALAQTLQQFVLIPFTGGASAALPIAQAAESQYIEAAGKGAHRIDRLGAGLVAGAFAAPGAYLNLKFLKGMNPLGKADFIERLTRETFNGLARTLSKDEARRATIRTVGEFIGRAPAGYFTEKYQEKIERVANKAYAKWTYDPTARPFETDAQEALGDEAAGIVGILGAGGGIAVSRLSQVTDERLSVAPKEIRDAVNAGTITEERARELNAVAVREAAKRSVTLKPVETGIEQPVKENVYPSQTISENETEVSEPPAQVAEKPLVQDKPAEGEAKAAKPEKLREEAAPLNTLSKAQEGRSLGIDEERQELRQPRQAKGGTYQGKETKIRIPDSKNAYEARYALREIEDVIPSHNPFNFQPNADYYFTNDRHYDKEQQYQTQVIGHAKNLDPLQVVNNSSTSDTGPPITDQDGNVLGGNSRAMSLHRAYNEGGADGYRAALQEQAAIYGITPEELARFKNPVLVREISDTSIDAQAAITDLNKTATTALTTAERAAAKAGKLSDDAIDFIAGKIESAGPGATLTDAANLYGPAIINKLIEDGVFTGGERNTLIDNGRITPDGKTRLERLLVGRVFEDLEQFEFAPDYLKRNIQRTIAPLVKTQGDPDWNILPFVREAIDLLTEYKAKGGKLTIDEYADTPSFVNQKGWSSSARRIAHVLKSSSPNAVSQAFKGYAGEYHNAKDGGGLFGASTPDHAFNIFFGDALENTDKDLEDTGKESIAASPAQQARRADANKDDDITDSDQDWQTILSRQGVPDASLQIPSADELAYFSGQIKSWDDQTFDDIQAVGWDFQNGVAKILKDAGYTVSTSSSAQSNSKYVNIEGYKQDGYSQTVTVRISDHDRIGRGAPYSEKLFWFDYKDIESNEDLHKAVTEAIEGVEAYFKEQGLFKDEEDVEADASDALFNQTDLFGNDYELPAVQGDLFNIAAEEYGSRQAKAADLDPLVGKKTAAFLRSLSESPDKQIASAAKSIADSAKFAAATKAKRVIEDASDALDIFSRARHTNTPVADMLRQQWLGKPPKISDRAEMFAKAMEAGNFPTMLNAAFSGAPVQNDADVSIEEVYFNREENARIRRSYEELSGLPLDSLIRRAEFRFDEKTKTVQMNDAGLLLANHALVSMKIMGDKGGMRGAMFTQRGATNFASFMDSLAKAGRIIQISPRSTTRLKHIAGIVRDGVDGEYGDLVIAHVTPEYPESGRTTLQEEMSHRADYRTLVDSGMRFYDTTPFESIPEYRAVLQKLRRRGYDYREIHHEFLGKLRRDDAAKELGLSEEVVDDFRNIRDLQLLEQDLAPETYSNNYGSISSANRQRAENYERSFKIRTGEHESKAGSRDDAVSDDRKEARQGSRDASTQDLTREQPRPDLTDVRYGSVRETDRGADGEVADTRTVEHRAVREEGREGAGSRPRSELAAASESRQTVPPEEPPTDRSPDPTSPNFDPHLLPVRLPEIIQIAKDLLGGKYPQISKRLRASAGVMQAIKGLSGSQQILIHPETAKNEYFLAQVVAHELGHLVDFLPNLTTQGSNILGRISSIKGYLKHFLAESPTGAQPLTEKERARLRREAKKLANAEYEKEVDEEIIKTTGVTPTDILSIWNSVDTSGLNPDLVDYIKGLNAREKKSIVIAALKGEVAESLGRFGKQERIKTGRKIKITVSASGSISAEYQRLITEEIRKRRLISRDIVREELIALTKWWSGDYSPNYKAYRESPAELYAEALSVLMNAPSSLKLKAPEFYRGFMNWMGNKPQFMENFLAAQEILHGESEAVAENRSRLINEMFERGDQKITAAITARKARLTNIKEHIKQYFESYIVELAAPVRKRVALAQKQGITLKDDSNAYYILDELNYKENANHLFLEKMQFDVYKPLLEADITRDDIGQFLLMRRIVNERNEMANPLGYTPSEAGFQLEQLKNRLGDEKFDLLEEKMQRFHDVVFDASRSAVEAGVYNSQLFRETIVPNKDNYAAFAVIKYLEDHVPASIHKQVGTFEEVANPFDTTIMKTMSLNRVTELNKAKNAVRDFLKERFPDEIQEAPVPYGKSEPRPPKSGHDHIVVMEDGKPVFYEVPNNIAVAFQSNHLGELTRYANILGSGFYNTFHPLFVTYNPGFLAANPFRDIPRAYRNLAAEGSRLYKERFEALQEMGVEKAEAKQLARQAKINVIDVAKALVKASRSAYNYAREMPDPIVDKMFQEKALSTPFVNRRAESNEDLPHFDRLMQMHGLTETRKSKHLAIRAVQTVLDGVQGIGVFQEGITKIAAYNMLSERSDAVSPKRRSYIVRKKVGTPDIRQKGVLTPISNTLFPYLRVKLNGLQADAELAFNRKSAAAWWWRTFALNITPKIVYRSIKYSAVGSLALGLLGRDDDEDTLTAMLARIPQYYFDHYDVIPLGTVTDESGDPKTLFISIPQDQTGAALGVIADRMMDLAEIAASKETKPMRAGNIINDIISVTSEQFGGTSVNPLIEIPYKWHQFSQGINPYDDYRKGNIIPRTEFQAGGKYAAGKMLSWTGDKFGILSTVTKPATDLAFGAPFQSEVRGTIEVVTSSIPGVSRLLRISDRGITEQELERKGQNEQQMAVERLELSRSARQLAVELNELKRKKSYGTISRHEDARRLALQNASSEILKIRKILRTAPAEQQEELRQRIDQIASGAIARRK